MIQIKSLKITYQVKDKAFEAVKNISFEASSDQIISLVGESGSGKTSIGKALGRLLDFENAKLDGDILINGESILNLEGNKLNYFRRNNISFIFQDPSSSLNPVLKIKDQILEVLEDQDSSKIDELLEAVQLKDVGRIKESYPHELSGGMKQRVVIAMAIAKKCKVLIADEPTTALDPVIQKEILDLLRSLQKKYRWTVLFITHDLYLASVISDKILILKDGELVEEVVEVNNIKNDYSKLLFKSANL